MAKNNTTLQVTKALGPVHHAIKEHVLRDCKLQLLSALVDVVPEGQEITFVIDVRSETDGLGVTRHEVSLTYSFET